MYKSIGMPEFYQEAKREALDIIDVREINEYELGHVPTAQNIPLSSIASEELPISKGKEYYVICQSGARSAQACEWFSEKGYDVVNVMGGTSGWPGALSTTDF